MNTEQGHLAAPSGDAPAAGAQTYAAPFDLHRDIMNLPCEPKWSVCELATFAQAYKLGHRDARHAAAEKALVANDLCEALTDVLRIAKAASIGVTGNAKRIARAEAALARARGE